MVRNESWILPAIVIAALSVLWAASFAFLTGYQGRISGQTSLSVSIAIITLAASWRFIRFLFELWKAGDAHPFAQIRLRCRSSVLDFLPIAIGVAILGAFLSSQTFLKSMIVAVVPFWADSLFASIDQAMHLDPQALASDLQGIMKPLGRFYGFWHVINLGGILWVLHWRSGQKSRLIISYMLTWGLGMALAYIFSSAGPIFTGRFDPQLAPRSVQLAVDFLWTNYKESGAALGGGISAFPSMHVAIAAWFAFVLRDRGLAWLGIGYAIAIFACSIILGWHYSLDGVGGVGVATAAWLIAPRFLNSVNAWAGRVANAVGDCRRPPVVR